MKMVHISRSVRVDPCQQGTTSDSRGKSSQRRSIPAAAAMAGQMQRVVRRPARGMQADDGIDETAGIEHATNRPRCPRRLIATARLPVSQY